MSETCTAHAAYVQSPDQISYRDTPLRAPGVGEILIDVLACGICGYDLEIAGQLAADKPKAFGHEIVGLVREVGPEVTHVAVGDEVALESGSFCGVCELCRNGRNDLCAKGRNFWSEPAMGFATAMITPACAAVPTRGLDPYAAVLAEPCGVALDMVKVAEIGLTDRVLVVGTGAIGLMALAIARRASCGPVVAANRSAGRLDMAHKLGADAVIAFGEGSLAESGKPYGGFDKVLVTAPPCVIPDCLTACAYGGSVTFIGFDWGAEGNITLNTTAMHVGKKQLRASFASPAMYFPEALQLLRSGVVPAQQLVSHRFPLSKLAEAIQLIRTQSEITHKVIIIPDERFSA
ncbi:MAG TPA: alcohol dehydrogenase catalytic domain-containing protein [Armatimonadota bacterium]|jgi:threonine dehydrogenase-like Zn-dependent dehydrogenase